MKDKKENPEQKKPQPLPPSPTSPAPTQSEKPTPPVPESPGWKKIIDPVLEEEIVEKEDLSKNLIEKESNPEQDLDMLKEELPKKDYSLEDDFIFEKKGLDVVENIHNTETKSEKKYPIKDSEIIVMNIKNLPEFDKNLEEGIDFGIALSIAGRNVIDLENESLEDKEQEVEMLPAESFKSPLDPVERKHYEKILKANRETIGSLRKQVQEGLETIKALKPETTDK